MKKFYALVNIMTEQTESVQAVARFLVKTINLTSTRLRNLGFAQVYLLANLGGVENIFCTRF
jgi:hypothetical protein